MTSRKEIEQAIYSRYIAPTKGKEKQFVGVEFELPLVNLKKEPVDFDLIHRMVDEFIPLFGFTQVKYDDEGYIFSAMEPETGDDISFDCSYNTLEFSFGKADNLNNIQERFAKYYSWISEYLRKNGHAITGMGINPYAEYNSIRPLPNGRYRMLLHHLSSYKDYREQMLFHHIPYYGLIACSAQTHIDAREEELPQMINVFNKLEPLKALLFANSPSEQPEGKYICVRDHLWRDSMHGLNPHNVDGWEVDITNIDEITAYIRSMSLYCTEREGKYINFRPTPIDEYFGADEISGEYYEDGQYRKISWNPELRDLEYLRSFKFVDLTFRGTLELRSTCMQPVSEALTVPAFHLGLQDKLDDLEELIRGASMYKQGYTPVELRKLFVRQELPPFADRGELKSLLEGIVELSYDGLKSRGKGEEKLVEPLIGRAERVESPAHQLLKGIESGKTIEDYIKEYGTL